jgi:hypothetical protein
MNQQPNGGDDMQPPTDWKSPTDGQPRPEITADTGKESKGENFVPLSGAQQTWKEMEESPLANSLAPEPQPSQTTPYEIEATALYLSGLSLAAFNTLSDEVRYNYRFAAKQHLTQLSSATKQLKERVSGLEKDNQELIVIARHLQKKVVSIITANESNLIQLVNATADRDRIASELTDAHAQIAVMVEALKSLKCSVIEFRNDCIRNNIPHDDVSDRLLQAEIALTNLPDAAKTFLEQKAATEKELAAAKSERARLKEQMRVARGAFEIIIAPNPLSLDRGKSDYMRNIAKEALAKLS